MDSMPIVEAPQVRMNQEGGFRVLGLCVKLLYWQGFWLEDSVPDIKFYLQFFSPRLARLFVKCRFLSMGLRFLHKFYRLFSMIVLSIQVFFLFPMGMYMFRDNKTDLVCNCYELIICSVVFTGMVTVLYHNRRLKSLLEKLEEITSPDKLDNEEQHKLISKTHVFCYKFTKYLHITIPPFVAVAMIVVFGFYLLPNRTFPIRDWYPFDATVTPRYEITVTLRVVETILFNATAITLISLITSFFIYLSTYFKILINKLQNIQLKSISEITKRNLQTGRQRVHQLRNCNNKVSLRQHQEHCTNTHVYKPRSVLATQMKASRFMKRRWADNLEQREYVNESNDIVVKSHLGIRYQLKAERVSINKRRVNQLQALRHVPRPNQPKAKSKSHQTDDLISHNIDKINTIKLLHKHANKKPALECHGESERVPFIVETVHAHQLLKVHHGHQSQHATESPMIANGSISGSRIRQQLPSNPFQKPLFVSNNTVERFSRKSRKSDNQQQLNPFQTRQHKSKPPLECKLRTYRKTSVDAVNNPRMSSSPLSRSHKIFPKLRSQSRVVRVSIYRKRVDHLQHINRLPGPRPRPTFSDNQSTEARYNLFPLLAPLTERSRPGEDPPLKHRASLVEVLSRATRVQEQWNRNGHLNRISFEELDREMGKQLAKFVDLHTTILRIAKELGSAINWYLTVMFVVNTVTLAVTALFFTTVKEYGPNEIVFLTFSMEIMMLYLMHNYMANMLTVESEAVGAAIYSIDWIGASPSFKKSMLIVMSRANQPLLIKPLGLEPLSLKLFTEVTISAYKMMSTLNRLVK